MNTEAKNPAAVALGSRGGQARASALTADERRKIAQKAAKASAKVRTANARKKKAKKTGQ